MTTWVENPRGGRDRGPRALVRAWVEILVRPRRFFRTGVAPGDQAPGLVFAVVVSLVAVAGTFAARPESVPAIGGGRPPGVVVTLLAVALFVAPALLHLTAALQTLALLLVVRDRAGVSETVQVIAYATAPCVLVGVPVPAVQALCGLYGTALLILGTSVVHRTSLARAAVASVLPATLVFGYGFRGFRALSALGGQWML